MTELNKITYVVTGFLPARPIDKSPPKIVEECLNGFCVNRYTGYDYGSYLSLYPMKGGRLLASDIPYKPKKISIHNTKRGY